MNAPLNVSDALARAKEIIAAREAKKRAAMLAVSAQKEESIGIKRASEAAVPDVPIAATTAGWEWNSEQKLAINYGVYRKTFCLIGAAGTGKTTTLRGTIQTMLEQNRIPPLEKPTKHLLQGSPGIALISYTRRAVRNIAKQMPPELKSHCITFHKLVEYEPHFYEEFNEESGEYVQRMRFEPSRNRYNPLPRSLTTIVIDEASMLSIDYFEELLEALPDPESVQFIFLGDLNQLPPVYGQAILGKALLTYPIVELTQVYRQALESPIIALALATKNNNFESFNADAVSKWGAPAGFNARAVAAKTELISQRGKITLHPWKKLLDKEDAVDRMGMQLAQWIKAGDYDPNEDLVLCPWNTSFGTDELNKSIADTLAKLENKVVHEVIAGFNKHYFAVGDRLMVDKQDCIILDIQRNYRYMGRSPQPPGIELNRWGIRIARDANGKQVGDIFHEEITNEQVDAMLAAAADVEDRTKDASHAIKVRFLDTDEEETITAAGVINNASFGYAITVHKAQGSECRKIFFLTHACHAAMCSRELVYTAITRAAEELYIVLAPNMLSQAAKKPRIKGDTLAAKLEFFNSRLAENAASSKNGDSDDD